MFTNFLGYVSTKALRVALIVALGATVAALTAIALVASSPAARADGDCQPSGSEVTCTFPVGTSTWTVPDGVTQGFTFDVIGAQGGAGARTGGQGGLGGETKATFTNLTPGTQLEVNVGGPGQAAGTDSAGGPGGINGGGNGGASGGGGGGGASDVRIDDIDNSGTFNLADRIIVGGGGGGGGGSTSGCFVASGSGGNGGSGDITGQSGSNSSNGGAGGGVGGTDTSGGFGGFGSATSGSAGFVGVGGRGGGSSSCTFGGHGGGGGGGGGGYYGGGGGGGGDASGGGGGGGGSAFITEGATNVSFQGNAQSGSGNVTITYTPPSTPTPPALSISDRTVAEGNSGTSQAVFTVSLSEASTQTITVDYATANDTATAGEDYQAASGTLTFAPGVTTQTVSVQVNGDTLYEPDEIFFVNLSNPANATISDEKSIGTITNDDQPPEPPDTQAPTVDTTSPVDVNGTMGKADLVTATFSEKVTGVSEQTFFLKHYTLSKNGRETYVPVTAKVTTPNDITAVLNPTKDLARGTYQATITNGVTDQADPANALVPKTWSFTVVR